MVFNNALLIFDVFLVRLKLEWIILLFSYIKQTNSGIKLNPNVYSHYSWPMTLNKQLPWTVVWVSLPVQLNNISAPQVWRENGKQLGTTPLNPFKQGRTWQRPCVEIRHVKKLWIRLWIFFWHEWRVHFWALIILQERSESLEKQRQCV